MNLQDVSHIHIPDGDVRMIHDSDNRLLWGAVGYNVLFSGNTFQQTYTGKNLFNNKATPLYTVRASAEALPTGVRITTNTTAAGGYYFAVFKVCDTSDYEGQTITLKTNMTSSSTNPAKAYIGLSAADGTNRVARASLSASGSCSYTIEQDTNRPCVIVALYSTDSGTPVFGEYVDYTDLQIEVGSTATSYEPFVGGQPSPSPDYPQQIQTVTGEQTVTVTGKNLLNAVPYATPIQQGVKVTITNTNTIHIDGTSTQTYVNLTRMFSTNLPAGTYTMSINKELPFRVNLSTILSGGGSLDRSIQAGETSVTFTTSETTTGMRIFMSTGGAGIVFDETFTVQLVSGNAADYDFEPYSSANYPISLGSLELCKLGTYQDYIYKDDGEWKIHKAIAKRVFNGTETWSKNGYNHRTSFNSATLVDAAVASVAISDNFIYWPNIAGSIGYSLPNNQFGLPVNKENIDFRYDTIPPNSGGDLLWKTYVTEHNITLYTAKTASAVTDITITDTNLIAQLEAIYNLVRRYGYNFVVSVSGNNLPIIIDRTLL